ncbi:hypothetical protein KCU76_g126, partial [Aureobasidium melanogenum]
MTLPSWIALKTMVWFIVASMTTDLAANNALHIRKLKWMSSRHFTLLLSLSQLSSTMYSIEPETPRALCVHRAARS